MERAAIRFDPELRPRLLPSAVLLRRSDDELQIGLDPAWRLADPTECWHRLLSRLDGRRCWRQLATEVTAAELADLVRLVDSLAAAGLADLGTSDPGTRRRQPRTAHGRVGLIGSDKVATTIAARLARSGVVPRIELPARLATSAPSDLTVIVADTLEADRAVAAELMRRDAPHLVVRPRPAGAVVGPLVLPGRTSCLHCADLTRRDADPAWPRLLGQLERATAGPYPAIVADWTVGVAVAQVLGFLAGQRPETCGATLELSAPRYAMAWRVWTPHAECGCRWPGSVVSM